MRGFVRVLFGIILILIFAFGCSQKKAKEEGEKERGKTISASAGEPAYGDTIIEGSIGDASNLIPHISSDSASHEIAALVYNGLVRYNKDLVIEGVLADSWGISEDGLTITFHLRKDVKWHDGVPFTADDVMFTYKTMIDPKTPTAYSGDFLLVKKAEVVDKHTFRVTYNKPFAPALISWSIGILPSHLLAGKDITKSSLARSPIGTGPYKFKEWKTGEKIVLESNRDYFEGRPYIDKYAYRIIPDSATMFLELKAGGIDWMGLTPLQYKRQTDDSKIKKNFNKFKYLSFSYTYLGFNLLDQKFKDKRIREAISYAIDKQELIDGVLMGLGVVADGPYKPDMWAYSQNVKKYPYNPEKARELLKEFVHTKKFEVLILGWNIPQDPDLYDVWYSSKTGPDELNHISFKNAEVDRLLIKARETFSQEERKNYYFKIQEILAEEQPYVFLYIPEALPIIHSRFRGIKPAPAGITYNFIKWYVPRFDQKYVETAQ